MGMKLIDELDNTIEDRISFKYYIENHDNYKKSAKNYGCTHNGVSYGANMSAVEMSICRKKDNVMVEISKGDFSKGDFRKIFMRFVEYCAGYDDWFEKMKNYSTERRFKIYSQREFDEERKSLDKNSLKRYMNSFRDLPFSVNGEKYHMSVNVNICTQMDYCCEIIPDEQLEEWFFCLKISTKIFPVYEAQNNEKYVERSKKIKQLSTDELVDKYEKELQNRITTNKNRQGTKSSPYMRSEFVSELAKRRAEGICELSDENGCYHGAPFEVDGIPYLESHHVKWLSQGGEDVVENVVALCPNCHKKMHALNKDEDKKRLLDRLQSYDRALKKQLLNNRNIKG